MVRSTGAQYNPIHLARFSPPLSLSNFACPTLSAPCVINEYPDNDDDQCGGGGGPLADHMAEGRPDTGARLDWPGCASLVLRSARRLSRRTQQQGARVEFREGRRDRWDHLFIGTLEV